MGSRGIWGDKSPSYTCHVALLKSHFPQARFIHIVRDVRDYCLSMHKAWGKNMFRAAARWVDSVSHADNAGSECPDDFLTLRYEDLLDDTERELLRICGFLGIEYVAGMSRLAGSVENLGDAKNACSIERGNKFKYVERMTPDTLRRIESISWPLLERFGYAYQYHGVVKRIGKLPMKFFQVADAFNLLRFHVRERGLFRGTALVLSLYRTSGNRQP